jgi:hypothetical protein
MDEFCKPLAFDASGSILLNYRTCVDKISATNNGIINSTSMNPWNISAFQPANVSGPPCEFLLN